MRSVDDEEAGSSSNNEMDLAVTRTEAEDSDGGGLDDESNGGIERRSVCRTLEAGRSHGGEGSRHRMIDCEEE